jgi:hypothetical protein
LREALERFASPRYCSNVTRHRGTVFAPRRRDTARDPLYRSRFQAHDSIEEIIMPAPFPPFTRETAIAKIRGAEDGWNSRDPERVSKVYTEDSQWRNRSEFPRGRKEIVEFLTRKWAKELDYRLIKELWAFDGNRIAVRYAYEWHDDSGNWFRSYGNENWEFNAEGLMARRFASINDVPIKASERKFHWPLGRRPDDHPGLSDLGL